MGNEWLAPDSFVNATYPLPAHILLSASSSSFPHHAGDDTAQKILKKKFFGCGGRRRTGEKKFFPPAPFDLVKVKGTEGLGRRGGGGWKCGGGMAVSYEKTEWGGRQGVEGAQLAKWP